MIWTEYYISSSASGGDGTKGSPWTLAEWWTNVEDSTVGNGSRGNVKDDGTYTQADLVMTRDAAIDSPIVTQGYLATPGDGGRPTIQRTAAEVGNWINSTGSSYLNYRDLKLDALSIGDGAGYLLGVQISTGSVIRCELTGGVFTQGLYTGVAVNCYIHGITCDTYTYFSVNINCYVLLDKVTNNGKGSNFAWHHNCVYRVTGTGANVACVLNSYYSLGCVFDGSRGLSNVIQGNTGNRNPIINCVIMNAASGQNAVSAGALLINCQFHNNLGGDYDNAKVTSINEGSNDPGFLSVSTGDYRMRNRSMRGAGLSQVGLRDAYYSVTPGVDQVQIKIAASGDVIETENAYGYSGDPIGGIYVRASGDQVVDTVSWGVAGEFTGLWDRPTTAQVEEDVEYGPTTKLVGTLEVTTPQLPLALSIDGVSGMNARNFTQNESEVFVITVTDKDDAAVNVSAAGTTITMWGKYNLDGSTSGYLFQKATTDFTKTVGGATNVISVTMSEQDLNWFGSGYLIIQFGLSGGTTPKAWLRLKGTRSPE